MAEETAKFGDSGMKSSGYRRLLSLLVGVLWHCLAAAVLLLGLAVVLLGAPIWSRPEALPVQLLLVGGYLVSVLILAVRSRWIGNVRLTDVVVTVSCVFGIIALALLLPVFPHSRRLLLATVSSAGLLALLFFIVRRARIPLAIVLALALAVAAHESSEPLPAETPSVATESVPSSFLTLQVSRFRNFVRQEKRGGAVAPFEDGYLLATADGRLYTIGWPEDSLELIELPRRVPLNVEEYVAGGGDNAIHFRVGDVLARASEGHVSVFVTHHYWDVERGCVTLRVSRLEGPRDAVVAGAGSLAWERLFEAEPCIPPDPGRSFAGFNLGGKLALLDEGHLLVSVGDHGFDGVSTDRALPQDLESDYGKIVVLNLAASGAELFSLGHRNPQGLYVDAAGRVWSTEHGPQGGDELNLIVRGRNYGWPEVTYGTHYGTYSWPPNEHPGEHRGFTRPIYAWVPSIGVSSLMRVEKNLFSTWQGDLLAASLGNRALWRLRIREDRVLFAERIDLGERIRDLAEGEDGRIVIWTDRGDLLALEPAGGEAVFSACAGCHAIGDGRTHGIGPDLRGVFGRPTASVPDFPYSDALAELGGRWTADRLHAYLEDPSSFVPGTTMEFEGVADSLNRVLIIDYLMDYR